MTVTDDDQVSSLDLQLNGGQALAVNESDGATQVVISAAVGFSTNQAVPSDHEVVVGLKAGSMTNGTFDPMLPVTVTATVAGANPRLATGDVTVTYTPDVDLDGMSPAAFILEASIEPVTDEAVVAVTDDDQVSSVDLQLNGADNLTVNESDGASVSLVISAAVALSQEKMAGDTYDVMVALETAGSDIPGMLTLPVTVPVTVDAADLDAAAGAVTVTYTLPPSDLDSDPPSPASVVLQASIESATDNATLTVNDDSRSVGNIVITVDPDAIAENVGPRDVVVTARLTTPAPLGGLVVVVSTSLVGTEGTGGTTGVTATATPASSISFAAGEYSKSTTLSINPADDNIFTTRSIRVTGMARAAGYTSGHADITVTDNDVSMGKILVTIKPNTAPSVSVGGGAQNVTLRVKVVLAEIDTEIPSSVMVNLMVDGPGTLASNPVSVTGIKKNPDKDPATVKAEGFVDVVLSFTAGEASATGSTTITGTASMYDSGSRTISIRDRDAVDIVGYRAVIVKPTGTNWARDVNHAVEVDVIRVGNFAYPWTDFQSIKVSLRDTTTAHATHEIDQVTASDFNNEDGTITFTESGSRGDVVWKGGDIIRFRIQVHKWAANMDPVMNGEYLGVYAHVQFTEYRTDPANPTSHVITNRESDKPVYPANPTIVGEANRYRGDGRLIRIDNKPPENTAIGAIRVTSGDEVGGNIDATVGDQIRVAVEVSKDVIFRDTGLKIELKTVDNTGELNGVPLKANEVAANSVKSVIHSAGDIIAAPSDSMFAIWDVTEGFIKVKADDFIEGIGNKGKTFGADNVRAQVFVSIQDLAGNFSATKSSPPFDVDSRSPGILVLYPSANPPAEYDHTESMHFTGNRVSTVEGKNVDAHLNPLRIVTDERLDMLEVFAVGSDTLDLSDQMRTSVIGDSNAVYNTSDLNSPKRNKDDTDWIPSSDNIGGTEIDLVILATDILGNVSKKTLEGVTHDAASPKIVDWFPQNRLIQDNQINNATRHPVFTLKEDVDSIAVMFASLSAGADDVKETQAGVTEKDEVQIVVSGGLVADARYTMTIFLRDLAGNVFITPADSSSNMRFNPNFDNPKANAFVVTTDTDSVIANQGNFLKIKAVDKASGTSRDALTYKNIDEDGNMAAEVRISAWDANGGAVTSFCFEGKGVTDDCGSPDGMATLDAGGWVLGKRTVIAKSQMAIDNVKILVEHRNAGAGTTTVSKFDGAIEDLYVGAADFREFEITAWEDGEESDLIWGDYTLRVVPVDNYGNPSLRAFKPLNGDDDVDSLSVLDTRVKSNPDDVFEYDEVAVRIVGVPSIEDLALLTLTIPADGRSFPLVAPANRRVQVVEVRIVSDEYLDKDDVRSRDINTAERFTISAPLTPVLTVWVEGMEGDQAGNDIVVPAKVTVAAEGYNAGDMVTFTQNGQVVGTIEANDEGVATAPAITVPVASTATVSATNGRYATDELTITFVDAPAEPARKSYVDANGDPVYLISDADMTVGVDDFLALVAAFGSSDGDANYNAQADVDDDGDVDVADFVEFITSFGRTAVGPATKPLVLAPGINENAEFSLSLGSERVVAGELVAVDVSLANVAALMGYGFALNYETDKFEFVSVAPADEDLLKSTGGETLFHHIVSDGQITVANGLYNGTAVSGGGDVVRFVFRVLREFEDNARFEVADGLVFDPSQLQNPAVVAGVLELQSTPREFALHQNFPNPFNPDTTIKYDLAESADVTLQIYNVLGQVVRTLVASEAQNAGRYQIRWNGMDDRGVPVSSGIYFYQISADGKFSDVRKLMLLK
ncbi:MAG: T9SS type A sorting domain-containing protein [Gemmatimonadetes bacterium]|nr:T9SS type A sorting domain-containing protein [Gemmatimonadota bacterium]